MIRNKFGSRAGRTAVRATAALVSLFTLSQGGSLAPLTAAAACSTESNCSTLSTSPASGVIADGTHTYQVAVHLLDSTGVGNSFAGHSVTLTQAGYAPAPGTPTRSNLSTINPPSVPADGSGLALFTVSATGAGAYTYRATDASNAIAIDQPATLTFVAGPAQGLNYVQGPDSQSANVFNAPFPVQPYVQIIDTKGNRVLADNSTTISLALTGGTGGRLNCTGGNSMVVTAGAAFFSGCLIDLPGSGYAILANSNPNLPGVPQAGLSTGTFAVAGPANSLAFFQSPDSQNQAGVTFARQPVVELLDGSGTRIAVGDNTTSVRIDILTGTGASGANLSCTANPVTAVNGVATFSGCSIDRSAPSNYRLHATSTPALAPADSPSAGFPVNAGPARRLDFTAQPCGGTCLGGIPWTAQPKVILGDSSGTPVTRPATPVTLSANGGGGVLTCDSNTVPTDASGVATFTNCSVDKIGSYNLVATTPNSAVSSATSSPFNITLGPATKVVFLQSPAAGAANIPGQTTAQVAVEDAGSNIETADNNDSITLTVNSVVQTQTPGGQFQCGKTGTGPVTAKTSGGVASFLDASGNGCDISLPGRGYTLKATATTLPNANVSQSFDAFGTPTQLKFLGPVGCDISAAAPAGCFTAADKATPGSTPSSSSPSVPFQLQPRIAREDANGSIVITGGSVVKLVLLQGTAAPGGGGGATTGTLACASNPTSTVVGIATFSGCSVNQSGFGYKIEADDQVNAPPGGCDGPNQPPCLVPLPSDTTAPFNISGAQSQLAWSRYPIATQLAGVPFIDKGVSPAVSQQPVLIALDANGNFVNADNSSLVNLALHQPGQTLQCASTSAQMAGGVAAFSGCFLNGSGTGLTLDASSPATNQNGSLTYPSTATSQPFDVNPGPGTRLVFNPQPLGSTVGNKFPVVVQLQDGFGNVASQDNGGLAIPLSLVLLQGTAPGGSQTVGTLTCNTPTFTLVLGVANLSCSVDNIGSGYRLAASTTSGYLPSTSNPFSINSSGPSRLAFSTQPTGTALGNPLPTQPVVQVLDASGILVTTDQGRQVRLDIASGSGAAGSAITCATNAANPTLDQVATFNGTAAFSGCSVNKAGAAYQLIATDLSAAPIAGAASNTFAISSAPNTQNSSVSISPTNSLPADGASAFVATVTLKDLANTPLQGIKVTPAQSAGPAATIVPSAAGSDTSNSSGVATFKITSSAGGNDTFTFTAGPVTLGPVSGTFVAPFLGSQYFPLTPSRVLDTRPAYIAGDSGQDLKVLGVGGVPNDPNVTAVVMNVTVDQPTAPSFLTVYPTGQTRPVASNLNFVPGQTVPNLVTVPVGTGGKVTIYNHSGNAPVIADMAGYYLLKSANSGTTGLFRPIDPHRIVDTRASSLVGSDRTMSGNSTITVPVTGRAGVPATGVGAVVLNITAVQPSAPGYVTAYPADAPTRPTASNLNFVAGDIIANRAIVKVSPAGTITIYNFQGDTDLVVDVNGWFTDGTDSAATGGLFNPLSPSRILDTRSPGQSAIGSGRTLNAMVTGLGGVPALGSTPGPTAVVMNVTEAASTDSSFLTVYPGSSRPLASDINFVANQIRPNLDIVKLGTDGSVNIYNLTGQTHVLADVVGWYS